MTENIQPVRILHANLLLNEQPGVFNQLRTEQNAAKHLPSWIDWRVLLIDRDPEAYLASPTPFIKNAVLNYCFLYWRFFRSLRRETLSADYLLVRYSAGDLLQYLLLRFAILPKVEILTIHHTLIEPELKIKAESSPLHRVLLKLERIVSGRLLPNLHGLVGVTHEIAGDMNSRFQLGKRELVYPNGIDIDFVPLAEDKREGIVKVLMVASTFPVWSGLDRLLKEVTRTDSNIELHLVGSIDPASFQALENSTVVSCHGVLDRSAIVELAACMDAGVDALGIDIKGLGESCSLKVREYLAMGLPVLSNHPDGAFEIAFPFYDVNGIDALHMRERCMEWRNKDRSTIREAAKPFIEKSILMEKLVTELCDAVKNQSGEAVA